MDIASVKKLVSDAYSVPENADVIPKFSTQFTFAAKELLIRIPIHECQSPPPQLLRLLSQVITTALPNVSKTPQQVEQDLLTAAEGLGIKQPELEIQGVVVSTAAGAGQSRVSANAVTECLVLIRSSG